jgi:hypothetical protein
MFFSNKVQILSIHQKSDLIDSKTSYYQLINLQATSNGWISTHSSRTFTTIFIACNEQVYS